MCRPNHLLGDVGLEHCHAHSMPQTQLGIMSICVSLPQHTIDCKRQVYAKEDRLAHHRFSHRMCTKKDTVSQPSNGPSP